MPEIRFGDITEREPKVEGYGAEPAHMPGSLAPQMEAVGEQERDPKGGESEGPDTEPVAAFGTGMRPAA